jgi:glutamate formiminotransferase/formiminotetrahydrofolate cyclodeaminase
VTNPTNDAREDQVEAVRRTLVEAALAAYEDAGVSGLCAEGRWEAAVSALRGADLGRHVAVPAGPGGRTAGPGGATLVEFADAVAAPTPSPGGGSVAGAAGALAAALVQMVAGVTVGRRRYATVEAEMRDARDRAAALVGRLTALSAADAAAYADVAAAFAMPAAPDSGGGERTAAIERALLHATEVPLEIARAATEVVELAAFVAEHGNANAVSDAGIAALLAEAVCRGAAYTVRVNVAALRRAVGRSSPGAPLADEAAALLARAGPAAQRVVAAVERSC